MQFAQLRVPQSPGSAVGFRFRVFEHCGVGPQGHARTIEQFAQGLARIARLSAFYSVDWRRLDFCKRDGSFQQLRGSQTTLPIARISAGQTEKTADCFDDEEAFLRAGALSGRRIAVTAK